MIRCLMTILCLTVLASSALASQHNATVAHQEIPLIKNAIENFLYNNTASLPGLVQINVGQIDKHLTLPKCPQLEPFVPAGGRLWGKNFYWRSL